MLTCRNRRPAPRELVRSGTLACLVVLALTWAPPASTDAVAQPPAERQRRDAVVTSLSESYEVPGTTELGMDGPSAIAVDHRGDLIVADTGNHRVLVIDREGDLVDQFGGYGWGEDRLDGPTDVCVYQGFYTYVLDEGNRRVARYDVRGDYVDLVVAEGEAGTPVSIAVGSAGGLFLVDSDSQSVLTYSQFDERLEPVGRFGLDAGGLLAPRDVAIGPSREVAVADAGRGSIEVFDEFGASLYSISDPDTLDPLDIAFDDRGNVIVVDGRRNRVLAFPRGGGPRTASLAGGPDFRFRALAPGSGSELAALDGESGRILLLEMVYGASDPGR